MHVSAYVCICVHMCAYVSDVIELYGGGGEQAVKYPNLLEKNILHLWPLYRIVTDEAVRL